MNSGNGEPITPRTSPFESIRRQAEDGGEYWSARDLAKILGYNRWENFQNVIPKAKAACANSGHAVLLLFALYALLESASLYAKKPLRQLVSSHPKPVSQNPCRR